MSDGTLAILSTHPIQYYAPWFRHLAARRPVEVLYAHRQEAEAQGAAGFGVAFDWDVPLLEGYPWRWLENVAADPGVSTWGGCDTPELVDGIEARGYAAVLSIGWNRKSALQAWRGARRAGVPILFRGDSQLPTPRPAWVRAAKWPLYRAALPRADAHLWVGARNRAYLRHYGVPERRLFHSPHFVDHDRFEREAAAARAAGARARIRAEHGLAEDDFVVLFVGKLTAKKRPADLLAAVDRAAAAGGRPVRALLVGDGPLRASLEAGAPEGGRFAGFVNQSRLPEHYVAADVLALPSDARETWGLVVNEAMATGLPAVVSEAAGCAPDLIDPGETGWTHPLGDVAALVDGLLSAREALADRPEAVRAAVAAKTRAHSMAAATEGLEAALAATGAG